jgi:hypothetical protein
VAVVVAGPVAVVDVLPQPLAHPRLIAPRHGRRSAPAQAQAGRPRDRVLCLAAVARRALPVDPAAPVAPEAISVLAPALRVDPVESALPQAESQVARETSQTDLEQAIDRALEIALELVTGPEPATDLELEIDLTSATALAVEIGLVLAIAPEAGIVLVFPIDPALTDPTGLAFPIVPALAVPTGRAFPIVPALAVPTDLAFPIDLALAVPIDLLGIDPALADPIHLALVARPSLTGLFGRAHLEGNGAAAVGVVGTTPGTVAGIAAAGA